MFDIIILNSICSFKVDFDNTFFVSRPNFDLKIPLVIEDCAKTNSFYLNNLYGEKMQLLFNGHILKLYSSNGI
jgi:hypothetical protein